MQKRELLDRGHQLIGEFCRLNHIKCPPVKVRPSSEWMFPGACAYYRPVRIVICLEKCAAYHGLYSFPGYTSDRTPYGVLAHELGHHVDVLRSRVKRGYFGNYSLVVSESCAEPPISSYAPNPAEWFAEMFRLYVTNPDLLRLLRPATWARLSIEFVPVVTQSWRDVLADAPPRMLQAAEKKICKLSPAR